MAISKTLSDNIAELLEQAELNRLEVRKITDDYPELEWDDAYNIQDAIRARKLARGSRLVGLKMGLTSYAKMRQMGVSNPIHGFLVSDYVCQDGGVIEIDQLIHPKVEAEIAFVLKRPIKGPGCTIADVIAATDYVLPALEIIDSRYKDFKFDLKSVIADNCSSSRFVCGSKPCTLNHHDLAMIGLVMEKNGSVLGTAAGASVLGNPATSVAMLANMVCARGGEVPAGSIILSGGATEAYSVVRGDEITLRVQDVGSVSIRFK